MSTSMRDNRSATPFRPRQEVPMTERGSMVTISVLALALLSSIALAAPRRAQEGNGLGEAKALFTRFVQLEQAYDSRVADLYADDAVIKAKRVYPTGEVREMTFAAPKYKQLIRQAMPLAKAR